MGKIGKFVHRLLKRGESAAANASTAADATDRMHDGPVRCIDGKLYRMRLRDGRWESFGPPLGDCSDEEE